MEVLRQGERPDIELFGAINRLFYSWVTWFSQTALHTTGRISRCLIGL